jgi:hypothetical protein
MVRNILAVIVGYIAIGLFVFISFSILYAILGTEGSFQPGTFEVSTIWIIMSFILGIIAALFGGYVCILISKNQKAVLFLAGFVLILGLVMAIVTLSVPQSSEALTRIGTVEGMDAMNKAITPTWINFVNPFIGAIFVFLGGRFRKENQI